MSVEVTRLPSGLTIVTDRSGPNEPSRSSSRVSANVTPEASMNGL